MNFSEVVLMKLLTFLVLFRFGGCFRYKVPRVNMMFFFNFVFPTVPNGFFTELPNHNYSKAI
jgi:hypothetical protein